VEDAVRKVIELITDNGGGSVFLGGSCNPTTWRRDTAIPLFEANSVKFYNPQVDDWTPVLVEKEATEKAEAAVLLFVIPRPAASKVMIEAAELIASGRRIVLVIQKMTEAADSSTDMKDCNRGRAYLEDQVARAEQAEREAKKQKVA
ncbi:unnamed protein product, partial [Symbiodinium sp. CCMP2456]